jgi:hypothetical protein
VLLGLLTCSHSSDHANMHYEVRLRDGGSVQVSIHYLTPSGDERAVEGMTPWIGPELMFEAGSTLLVRAETPDDPSNPLQCILAGSRDDGEWLAATIEDPLNECRTSYELGQWPPNDNTGSLIRVG